MEKRKHARNKTTHHVRFTITVKKSSEIQNIHLTGTITDISPEGFSLSTNYPLLQGQLLTIDKQGRPGLPKYGIVRWVTPAGKDYKAGLRHGKTTA